MKNYCYNNETVTIHQFDQQKPFSSFLPGIAGLRGVPIWAFYANRGQAITCFGIENKDRAILDFQPANLGYQYTHINGFRTFIKVDGGVYEPFSPINQEVFIKRDMQVNRNEITLIERNTEKALQVTVTYYALPEEEFGALVREVRIENLGTGSREFEVFDGLAVLLPSGVDYDSYKQMSNLMRSWMDVFGLESSIPLYRMRAATSDEAEVKTHNPDAGNFFFSRSEGKLLPVIVDPKVIFAFDTTLSSAQGVRKHSFNELIERKQATVNQVPCGFSAVQMKLAQGKSQKIETMIGYTENIHTLRQKQATFLHADYFVQKRNRGTAIINKLIQPVETKTAHALFDTYAKQNYLDNVLRGGKPIIFGTGEDAKVYHVYSRKHGDPERDYNFFTIAPEYYSQGNGNFRDVNQNRRNDILFNPEINTYNIQNFFNLIQLDGYNPLHVKGTRFTLKQDVDLQQLVHTYFDSHHEVMETVLSQPFTPGIIINTAAAKGIKLHDAEYSVLSQILEKSDIQFEASFGEGYWVDHWTYNFDLVENYCAIFPEKVETMLLDEVTYQFYESGATIFPRSEKYVLTNKGEVRQYGATLEHDEEKISRLGLDASGTNWVRHSYGKGEVYQTTLIEKMIHLIVMKFLNLDPAGIGIEMEADKPGWNDAMNGLPGIFGSGVSESVELLRIATFLQRQLKRFSYRSVELLEVNSDLLTKLQTVLESENMDAMYCWNALNTLKESYRQTIRFGVLGETKQVSLAILSKLLEKMIAKLNDGIHRGRELGEGLLPTFLSFDAKQYHLRTTETGEKVYTHYGLPAVEVDSFSVVVLPNFLEAPARYLKVCSEDEAKQIHQQVKASQIYDPELQMYKTSESLENVSFEIGRARAFTPGWLEREAVFLHMTYKYLLGLLKAGLYDTFYEEIRTNFVCFRDSDEYGRSVYENVSFLASSVNPDETVHGQGFVARLTGATSEFLSMWHLMMIGKKWFQYENDVLTFTFEPLLAADFFNADSQVTTRLFDTTTVIYTNETKKATYGKGVHIAYMYIDGRRVEGGTLTRGDALLLRDKQVKMVEVFFTE